MQAHTHFFVQKPIRVVYFISDESDCVLRFTVMSLTWIVSVDTHLHGRRMCPRKGKSRRLLLFTLNETQLWGLFLSVQISAVEPHIEIYACSNFPFAEMLHL